MVLKHLIPLPGLPPLTLVLSFCHHYIFYSFRPPQYIPPTNFPTSSGPLTRCISYSTNAHKDLNKRTQTLTLCLKADTRRAAVKDG